MRAALAALLSSLPLSAQEAAPPAPALVPALVPEYHEPVGTRLISVATPYTVKRRNLEVLFMHRFRQSVQDGDSHTLWGLDSGADVGIGLAWGLTSRADVSLLRSSFQEDYELAGKFATFEQSERVPLSMAVRVGVDHLGRVGAVDPDRPFAQVIVSRRLAHGFNVLLAPSWVQDTERLHNAVNVPVGLTLLLPGDHLVEIEVVPKNRDLGSSVMAWHVAVSKELGGHVFKLLLGNSRALTVDQIVGGDFAGGFERGDVRLGFNLIRNFGS